MSASRRYGNGPRAPPKPLLNPCQFCISLRLSSLYNLPFQGDSLIELLLMVLAVGAFSRQTWILRHYKKYQGRRGVTGCEIARQLLDQLGCSQMTVLPVAGWERYNGTPMREVFLEPLVYEGKNLQAIAKTSRQTVLMAKTPESFLPLEWVLKIQKVLRFLIFPAWVIFILRLMFQVPGIFKPGLWVLEFTLLVALLEWPREWEVSRMAYELLSRSGWFDADELVKLRYLLEAERFESMTEIFRVPREIFSSVFNRKREKHGL